MRSLTNSVACTAVAFFLALTGPLLQGCSANSASEPESEASSEAELQKSKGKLASFTDLANQARDNEIESGDGCTFATSKKDDDTLELTVTSDEDGTLTLSVTSDAHQKIRLVSKEEQSTYTIAGVGRLDIINADDAFNRVTLTSADGSKSVACEVDF